MKRIGMVMLGLVGALAARPVRAQPSHTPPPGPTSPALAERPDPAVEAGLGLTATRSLGGPTDLLLADLRVNAALPQRGCTLVIGAVTRFPGRARFADNTPAGPDAAFTVDTTQTRIDFGLHGAIGLESDRFAARVGLTLGISHVRTHVAFRTSVNPDGEAMNVHDARTNGLFGLSVEGRVALVPAVWLSASGALEALPGSRYFLGDQKRVRALGTVALVFRIGT